MNQILIVEDEPNLAELYRQVLQKAGFQVLVAENGQKALALLAQAHVDLIITDLMMPTMDGFAFTQNLREVGYDLPILVITAKDTFADKEKGFQLGVDDYMVKPINVQEMLWRVNALLRRAKITHESELVCGQTVLNLAEMTVVSPATTVELRNKEFQILYKLLSYPNKIFTRQQLMEELWGPDTDTEERTIDVHIRRLRQRTADNEDFQIITIRGLGYKAVLANED
jgi:Response regulators consisting of a CheY-like receiver domain and a winged-helix DNA-binding domain